MNTMFDAFDDSQWQALPPGSDVADWELAAAGYELAMLTAEDAARGAMPPAVAAKIAREAARLLPQPRRTAVRPASSTGWALPVGGSPLTVAAATVAALLAVVFAWRTWTGLSEKSFSGGVARPCGAAPAEPCR
jgi:hypothetical protein